MNVEMVNLRKAINDNLGHVYLKTFHIHFALFVNVIQTFLNHCHFRSLLSYLFS